MLSSNDDSYRGVLSKTLREVEVTIDYLSSINHFSGKHDIMVELMSIRGILATLLQWSIEERLPDDIPF